MTTAKTITDSQIRTLRDEAAAAGDDAQVNLCNAALGLAAAWMVDEAREQCAKAIAEAADVAGTWFIVVCPAEFERLDGVMPGVRAHILGGGETRDAAMSSAARRAGAWLSGVRVVPWADEDRPESGVCYRDAAGQPWHGFTLRTA